MKKKGEEDAIKEWAFQKVLDLLLARGYLFVLPPFR